MFNSLFLSTGAFFFFIGFLAGTFTRRKIADDGNFAVRRVRPSLRSPMRSYVVDCSEYKNIKGRYVPVKPQRS